jgi:hypothetical protein
MRIWARKYTTAYKYTWVEVTTDANGFNDAVYLSAFCQVLQLQPQESPFYAEYGIPSIQAVQSQVVPDTNVYFMQSKYSQYFISLQVIPAHQVDANGAIRPVYNVTAITNSGATISAVVPI